MSRKGTADVGSGRTASQPPTGSVSTSSSTNKQRNRKRGTSPSSGDHHCATCESKFIIFSRKIRCDLCRTLYCGDCWKAGLQFFRANYPHTEHNKTTCKRCKILSGPTYSWNQLMELKARELMQFLRSKYVDTATCVSKEDLADLIVRTFSSDAFLRAQTEHEQRVAMMMKRLQQDSSDSPARELGTSPQPAVENVAQAETRSSIHNETQRTSTSLRQETQSNATAASVSSANAAESSANTCRSNWRQRPANERVLIEEIEQESYLTELSSKQLKDILAFNFIDYRGVLERCELVDLTRSLWRSRHALGAGAGAGTGAESVPEASIASCGGVASANSEAAGETPRRQIDDRELCKICMEREIDCVLLECGHLVTCTECGRVLADCPICRRFVARVVHVFKT